MAFCQAFFLFFPEKSENIPRIGAKASFFMPKFPVRPSMQPVSGSPLPLPFRPPPFSLPKERKELLKPATPSGTLIF